MAVDRDIEHLLRRGGVGARPDELTLYRNMSTAQAVEYLVNYDQLPDDVDDSISQPGFVGMTSRGQFSPRTNIQDARQRWLFRMVHTNRPLQEKMALFWHNHFATAYSKIAGFIGAAEATRYLASKPSEDPASVRGQLELFREHALGNFQTLLVEVAKDVAMLYWLDGRTNVRERPQENFAREIMELFTIGVGHFAEEDVYAAARVFTGWNVSRPGAATDGTQHYEFLYRANQHDTNPKTFSFPIYPDGGRTIPGRPASDGMQDGLDFVAALAGKPETARLLARKLFRFFVNETSPMNEHFVDRIATRYLASRYDMRAVMREVLLSPEFWDPGAYHARYAWPVEFVVRTIKDVGWAGFSVNDALTPLGNMGQNLFEPPDVNGWDLGPSWFSTGAMLARMNFGAAIAANQRFRLATAAQPYARTPETLLAWALDALPSAPLDVDVVNELSNYLHQTGSWTASAVQLQQKVPGLVHLITGTAEYQFV